MVKSSPATYIPSLDGFRGCSILLVFFAHLGFEDIIPGGLGVTIFFFVSGYIITRLLLLEFALNGSVNIRDFFIRRLLRLYPPLLFMLIISYLYLYCLKTPINRSEIFAASFYYENYYFFFHPSESSTILKILWSLAVEEHFYLVFPFLFLALINRYKIFIALLGLLIIVPLIFRLYGVAEYSYSKDVTERYCYTLTHTRFDSIIFGCLAAVLLQSNEFQGIRRFLANRYLFGGALVLFLLCLVLRDDDFRNTFRYTLQGTALFILVPAITDTNKYQKLQQLLSGKLLVLIGKMSYSIYLLHMLAQNSLLFIKATQHSWLYYPASVLGTIILTMISYHFVEKPFAKLRRRFAR